MRDFTMKLYVPEAKIPVEYKTLEADLYKCAWRNFDNDRLKTWKHVLTVSRPCGRYESGIVNIYKTKKPGIYSLVTYYDGSFYPLVAYSHLTADMIKAIKEYKAFLLSRKKRG